ncbi:MAG: Zn-dependent alcohol dehydrogenase [Chloroflexota bacterium]|nr:Zn-dependent alcohol dehydrogenase [Chloroflexota bacterium]
MPMQIRAAVLDAAHTPFRIETLTLDEPRAGEVRVRLASCGVCHSDWHIVTGATRQPFPIVCGHEGAGVVESVGAGVTTLAPGDHVILNWAPACGECFYCQHHQTNLCSTFTDPLWQGTMLDGTVRLHRADGSPVYAYCGLAAFAEYTVVPFQACVRIRQDFSLTTASLIGCAVATGVGAAWYTADVQPGSTVVVIGCGGVGLNTIQGAAERGAVVIIGVDVNPAKQAIARTFGATHFVHENVLAEIRALTGGHGADYSFEAVGTPALQELAFGAARPGGMVILEGLSPMGTATNLPGALITRQEKTIKGSYYGSVDAPRDFPLFVEAATAGRLTLDALVSRTWALDEINAAYADMLTGGVARGVIVF